jgi:hypothetical protein
MRQCCAVKNQHENNKISGAEMRMLHWMCGKSRQERIMNDIRERVGVAPIVENLVETQLRWFRYVERRHVDSAVRRIN